MPEEHPPDDSVHKELWLIGYLDFERDQIIHLAERCLDISAVELGHMLLEEAGGDSQAQLTDLPISRQEIAEVKADIDNGRVPQIIWLGVYPREAIMATMIFYALEDEYNAGNLSWAQFASGVLAVSRESLGGVE